MIALHNDFSETQLIYNKERIAQMILIPFAPIWFEDADKLDETDRGEGGFGSTGQ